MGYDKVSVSKMADKLRDSDYEYVSVRLANYRAKLEIAQRKFAETSYSENRRLHLNYYCNIRYNETMIRLCEEILTEKENNYGYQLP